MTNDETMAFAGILILAMVIVVIWFFKEKR
jgi:Mg2+ and Co2+ transporter CorA